MAQIKINRALRLSKIGKCPQSAADMLAALPWSAIGRLRAVDLAELVDAMWAVASRSKAIAVADAIAEGYVWDAGRQCERRIGQ